MLAFGLWFGINVPVADDATKIKMNVSCILWIQYWNHHIDLVAIVHIGVGHHVVIALSIVTDLIIIIVVVIDVVGDIGHHGKYVHGCGQKCHLS